MMVDPVEVAFKKDWAETTTAMQRRCRSASSQEDIERIANAAREEFTEFSARRTRKRASKS
jgi:hypothetical protein